MNVERLAERVRAEFEEAPGLVLTVSEAARFFGLDQDLTRAIVDRLVHASHLRWTRTGALTRAA